MWLKLSDMSGPLEFGLIHGLLAVVAHKNRDGSGLFEDVCVARYDMDRGFFVTETDGGEEVINHGVSGGEVYFILLPEIP